MILLVYIYIYIIFLKQQISLATVLWEQRNRSVFPPFQTLHAGWSVAPYLCPVFLLRLVDGFWFTFDFQQGIWFPQNEPKRTKDSAFSAELQQALAMMEDLIKSCELAVDLAAVTGCPVCSIASIGTFHTKGRCSITKVGDAMAKLEKWSVVRESDAGESSLNRSANPCYEIPSSPSAFLGILSCIPDS